MAVLSQTEIDRIIRSFERAGVALDRLAEAIERIEKVLARDPDPR
jgi:uncharacterized membrane protein